MAIELGAAYISVLPSTSKLAPALKREFAGVDAQAKAAGDRAGSSFGSSFKSKAGLLLKGGLLAGAAGIGLLGAAGLKTAADLEQSQIGFETMLGSAEKANAFMKQITDTAAKTPFELPGLTQSSQKLLAFGFQAKDVIPTLTTLGDAAAGLGVGQEGLDRIILSVGQIQAKGKVQSDELLQLTENGVPALKILANGFHKSTAEMQQMVTDGLVPADKAIPKLLDGIKNGTKGAAGETAKFGGLMAKQSQSLSGLFSTLKDTVLVGIAKAITPLLPMIKDGLAGAISALGPAIATGGQLLADFIAGMKSGKGPIGEFRDALVTGAQAVGDFVHDVLPGLISTGRNLFTILSPLAQEIGVALAGAFITVQGAVRGLAPILAQVTGFLASHGTTVRTVLVIVGTAVGLWKAWTLAISIWQGVIKVGIAVQTAFNAVLAANPIGLVIVALVALAAGLVYAYKHSETFRNIVNAAFSKVKSIASAVANFFTHDVVGAFNSVKGAASNVLGWIKGNWPIILAVLTGPFGIAVAVIAKNWDRIKSGASAAVSFVKGQFDHLIGFFSSLPGRIAGAVAGAWNSITEGFRSAINTIIGWWNGLSLSVDIPNKIPGLPDSFSVGTPDVPYLAEGGIVTRPTLAVIGEAGPEAVVPLSHYDKQRVAASSARYSSASAGSRRAEFTITNWRTGEGYFREIATDEITNDRAFQGLTRRMR